MRLGGMVIKQTCCRNHEMISFSRDTCPLCAAKRDLAIYQEQYGPIERGITLWLESQYDHEQLPAVLKAAESVRDAK